MYRSHVFCFICSEQRKLSWAGDVEGTRPTGMMGVRLGQEGQERVRRVQPCRGGAEEGEWCLEVWRQKRVNGVRMGHNEKEEG